MSDFLKKNQNRLSFWFKFRSLTEGTTWLLSILFAAIPGSKAQFEIVKSSKVYKESSIDNSQGFELNPEELTVDGKSLDKLSII